MGPGEFVGGRSWAGRGGEVKDRMQNLSSRFQHWMGGPSRPRSEAIEPPLRAELFSVEQLARHAKALAENHQVVIREGANRLLARLDFNEQILRSFNRATLAVDKTRRV